VADLVPDPRNARRHTARNVETITSALQKVGAARSIVIDEGGVVLAGNATMRAAKAAGITKVRVVETDGTELVAVRRSGLSATQKAELAVYDNRAAELAEGWDLAVLRDLEGDGLDLTGLFTEAELATLRDAPDPTPVSTSPQLAGLEYRVVVDCRDEQDQADLLARFEKEHRACRALTS